MKQTLTVRPRQEPLPKSVRKLLLWLRRGAPRTRLGNSVLRLGLASVLLYAFAWLPHGIGGAFASLGTLTLLAALLGLLPMLVRWTRWRMLWKLRNRLLVTYLLIGLAPVVLFGTLAAIAAYVLSGQFANFVATAEIGTQLQQISAGNHALAAQVAHRIEYRKNDPSQMQFTDLPFPKQYLPPNDSGLQVRIFVDGQPLQPSSLPAEMELPDEALPVWVHGSFQGLAVLHQQVYFRAIHRRLAAGHTVVTIASLPLNRELLGQLARGLGKITLLPMKRNNGGNMVVAVPQNSDATRHLGLGADAILWDQSKVVLDAKESSLKTLSGGKLAKRENLLDIPIDIPTFLTITGWKSGRQYTAIALVTSRPSLLYQQLFRQSVLMGTALRIALLGAAFLFAVLQLLALWMAGRLSRTITHSISDLYAATRAVDAGRLNYRIQVTRNDQLADLSRSFNRMTASLEKLMQEQHEKERMDNELAIAQEVQASLFPSASLSLPHLELYGFCRPARGVSGDYYDFLPEGDTGIGLAIGDISGKGISAALLMATLHSAVRAYRLQPSGAGSKDGAEESDTPLLASPARILSLLNRHLHASTQPEKYATLFLAHYDGATSTLRYSNGGHLPPLVLCADGHVERLHHGGAVIGLLDRVQYREGSVQLHPGDLFIGYTDGVTEPENEFGEFGETRMLTLIRQNRHLPLPEICMRLLAAIDEWIGDKEQPDDITLVLARQR
jgi:sigma-B regulation protein RsbU (phosphoserine phosphatase)